MKLMPQEIEVRYVIPALRKELATGLANKGLKQKEIATMLDLTPAAVSMYLADKRGHTRFKPEVKDLIKRSINKILAKKSTAYDELYNLSKEIIKTTTICDIHRMYDEVPKKCEVCFEK